MTRFSVRKPFTVLVAVVIVVVLGFVSYSHMTPDLLPSINLPYVMVTTAYPGATPEKVESTVTKPLEQAMATLEHIESITSTSAANYSNLVLEFTEDANLDSIEVDILQNVQRVSGSWDEGVGTPSILKINPDMLPVMVASVDREGMDTAQLSAFVEETVLPKLEGVSGVASVTSSGLVTEQISVTLDQEKIEALNASLREKIDRQIEESGSELDEAQEQIDQGEQELQDGKDQLDAGKDELLQQTGDAGAQLDEKAEELRETKLQLRLQIADLQAQLADLQSRGEQLGQTASQLSELNAQIASLQEEVQTLGGMASRLQALGELQAQIEAEIAAIEADETLTQAQKLEAIAGIREREEVVAAQGEIAEITAQLAARNLTPETLAAAIEQQTSALTAASAAKAQFTAQLEGMGIEESALDEAARELEAGKAQLSQGIETLQQTLSELDAGSAEIAKARAELEKQRAQGILTLSETTAKLLDSEAQLNAGKAQLEEGMQALEDGRQSAYDAANVAEILTPETVVSLLTAQNFDMPAGYAEEDDTRVLVSVGDGIESEEQLRGTVLLDLGIDGVEPIRLSDVAEVEKTDDADEVYARINGAPGVLLSFQKQSTSATAEVSRNLAERFESLSADFEGLHFNTLMDQGDYIYLIMNSIMKNMMFSALFSVLVLVLFLKDWRPTLMTLCSIPLSVLFAIVLMYFSGVTLNVISLSALTVSIGMLVDNSVVVIENIYRLRHKGLSPVKAAVSGAMQVAGAVAASTFTTVCVFLPIVFVEGLTRQLFTDMALTLGYALVASLIVSLTLVPAMSSRLLGTVKEHSHKWFDGMLTLYRRSLGWTLRHKAAVLVFAVLLLVGSTFFALSRGFSYMPEMSTSQVTVSVQAPRGTSEKETMALTDEVCAKVQDIPGVQTVGAMLSDDTSSILYMMLEDGADSKAVANEVSSRCEGLDAEVTASGTAFSSDLLGGEGVQIHLYGDDLQNLQEAANRVAEKLAEVEGAEEVDNGIEETDKELHFTVDREKAAKAGLTTAQVTSEIAKILTGDLDAGSLSGAGDGLDISVKSDTPSPQELRDCTFTVTDRAGERKTVKLSDVATVQERETLPSITRIDQRRTLTVSAEVAQGHNVTLVTSAAQRALRDFPLPDGVSMEFAGENETIMESVEQLLQMLVLGILLVYLVMVAQFQSLKSPFIVMFTIPLAFTGGFLGLLLTGQDVSIISLIGFVMLCGIVVNNGIVLVDYVNQLRLDGMEKREALAEAGATRMRPILMTSITTVLGLLITSLGSRTGSELMQPVAIVCIGGLLYATLMTLYVVPVMYDLFHRREMKKIDERDLELSDE